MANATARVPAISVPWGDDKIERPLAAASNVVYYPAQMMCLDTSGNAVGASDSTSITFAGLNDETVRIEMFSGDAAGSRVMKIGRPWRFSMAIASAAPGDEGKAVYVVDNQTVGYTSVNAVLVGYVDQVLSATVVLIQPVYIPPVPLGVVNNTITFTGATGANTIVIPDNLANALTVEQGSTAYLTFVTTDGSELTKVLGAAATAVTNTGGGVRVTGGIGGATSGAGGTVIVTGGAGTNGNAAGGAVSFIGGLGQGSAAGGAVTITSGAAGATGVAGAVNISVGGATAGNGSAVTITGGAGAGSTNAGGNVNLVGGAAVSTGIPGEVQVNADSNLMSVQVALTATDASRAVFICPRAMRLKAVNFMHTTGSTSGTLQIEKLTGTTAAGSGTTLLTGTIDLSTTTVANTSTAGTLIATVASLTFAAGDRVSVKIAGTMTGLVGGIVTIGLAPC